jgi:hypothetical protein
VLANKRMQLTAPLGVCAGSEDQPWPPRVHSRTGAAADPQRWTEEI